MTFADLLSFILVIPVFVQVAAVAIARSYQRGAIVSLIFLAIIGGVAIVGAVLKWVLA